MIVGRSTFAEVLANVTQASHLSFDTETTGKRYYKGDRLFSFIICDGKESYYFNFQAYDHIEEEYVIPRTWIERMLPLFHDEKKLWFMHNAKFDLHMAYQEGIEFHGTVHCTQANARVEFNDHIEYNLDACARRIGLAKESAVEKHIVEAGLWEWEQIPGKQKREKVPHFWRVPFPIISKYGESDGWVTHRLGEHQVKAIREVSEAASNAPPLTNVLANERLLTKTCYRMERFGVKVDLGFCTRAVDFEQGRAEAASREFKQLTGTDYVASPVLFKKIFEDQKEKWQYNKPTKTGQVNPCFDSEVLRTFKSPVAEQVLILRDAKAKSDFYHGFLYYADSNGRVHTNLNQGGTNTGRFSSSEPNFQNLKKDEDEEVIKNQEFLVRRAIVPEEGFFLASFDFDQMEYKLMLDYVGYEPLVEKIKAGADFHQATADLVTSMGFPLTRKRAKNGNFAVLYCSGAETLSHTIGTTVAEAQKLKDSIFEAIPPLKPFIRRVERTACVRGNIFNWFGRRYYFEDPRWAYRATNYLIQGGCADIVKIAMNRIDEHLRVNGYKTRMILQVHDELLFEVAFGEERVLQEIKHIMESVYPPRHLSMTAGLDVAYKSWADKEEFKETA